MSQAMDNQTGEQGLDPKHCRLARLSRDPRFDGEFFVAVETTGIYCRPVCPARPPAEKNVTYYRLASQAAAAGYRPCLRCRPESAPGSPAWAGSCATVQRALKLIRSGALNEGGRLSQLAERLGVGERYLRRLFDRELGVSPQKVALNQRLLFAKKLLMETRLPITEVAFAAGYGSIRRFNSAMQENLALTPNQLRGGRQSAGADAPIDLRLSYRPPYDWDGVIRFLRHHALEGLEAVGEQSYHRRFSFNGQPAWLEVRPDGRRDALRLTMQLPDHTQLQPTVNRVRRMFDLDANPEVIAQQLRRTPALAGLLARSPGVRTPGHWSFFEAAVRAIVGQQVSTVAARGICTRLVRACADPEPVAFPTAQALAALDDSHFPMPGRRRETLRDLCRVVSAGEGELDLDALSDLRGVGPWTVAMVAIRGTGEPDAFPFSDLGLVRAWEALGDGETKLKDQAIQWSPWRSYAANLLWRSLD